MDRLAARGGGLGGPPGRRGSRWAILAVLLVLAFVAPNGEWVSFPLSRPLRAHDLHWAMTGVHELSTTRLYLLGMLAAILLAPIHRGAALILAVGVLALLGLVFLRAAWLEPGWIETYLRETHERLTFSRYVNTHFDTNRSVEPTFVPIEEFESSIELLELAWTMLGWGYQMATVATLGLVMFLILTTDRKIHRLTPLLLLPAFVGLARGPELLTCLSAEHSRRVADRALTAGRAAEAVATYRLALVQQPTWRHSRPFLRKASMAFHGATGGRSPLGALTPELMRWPVQGRADSPAEIEATRLSLQNLDYATIEHADPLAASIRETTEAVVSELWIAEGLRYMDAAQPSRATAAYARAAMPADSFAPFYVAHADLQLRQPEAMRDAVPRLQALTPHPVINADLLSSLGDALTRAGRFKEARDAYIQSRKLDGSDNFRAVRALSGG